MANWKKMPQQEMKDRVFMALAQNTNYYDDNILGLPGSHLDKQVFYQDAPFLKEAPFLTAMIRNPNHIGCHTLGESEHFFSGTQQIERELIQICAEDIFKGKPLAQDGYVAAGGTEANMQAVWIYRNYFFQNFGAKHNEIFILCSEDAHYCVNKAADVFSLDLKLVSVDFGTRAIQQEALLVTLDAAKKEGKKYVIVFCNMMTTMFGSVDNPDVYVDALNHFGFTFKMHVDGAYGGFFYPFTDENNKLNFANPNIDSITVDAHKMAQAPYGTGIFLCRKNLMQYTNTKAASYVEGEDFTLIGSRSGANAIAVWMILMTYGYLGWKEKSEILLNRAKWFASELNAMGIKYFRQTYSNIVTMEANQIPDHLASKYALVPDSHHAPKWLKVVVMDHVTREKLQSFLDDLALTR